MNRQKYIDMAYQNPRGKLALQIVETNWPDWVRSLKCASNYIDPQKADKVAGEIFWASLWGFGVENWSPRDARELRIDGVLRNSDPSSNKNEYPWAYSFLDIWLEKIFFRAALYISK